MQDVETKFSSNQPLSEDERALSSSCPTISHFLTSTSSQLTYYGLSSLHSNLPENTTCVFFRNNHFNTLFKHERELWVLVSDEGFVDNTKIVWEKLHDIDGDTALYDSKLY